MSILTIETHWQVSQTKVILPKLIFIHIKCVNK